MRGHGQFRPRGRGGGSGSRGRGGRRGGLASALVSAFKGTHTHTHAHGKGHGGRGGRERSHASHERRAYDDGADSEGEGGHRGGYAAKKQPPKLTQFKVPEHSHTSTHTHTDPHTRANGRRNSSASSMHGAGKRRRLPSSDDEVADEDDESVDSDEVVGTDRKRPRAAAHTHTHTHTSAPVRTQARQQEKAKAAPARRRVEQPEDDDDEVSGSEDDDDSSELSDIIEDDVPDTHSYTNAHNRMAPEEDDPDAALIASLERKLGIRKEKGKGVKPGEGEDGKYKKALSKLNREFAAEGFDDDFATFLENIGRGDGAQGSDHGDDAGDEDDVDASGDDAGVEEQSELLEDEEDGSLIDGMQSEDDDDDGETGQSASDVSSVADVDGERSNAAQSALRKPQRRAAASSSSASSSGSHTEDDGDGEPFHSIDPKADATARRKAKFAALYGRSSEEQSTLVTPEEHELLRDVERAAAEGKYVPPRMRKQAEEIAARVKKAAGARAGVKPQRQLVDMTAPHMVQLRRRCQGLLNRLSEANIEPIANELAAAYQTASSAECNAVLLALMKDACTTDSQVLRPLVMVYGALISALHILVGPGVGAYFIEHVGLTLGRATRLVPSEAEEREVDASGKLSNNLLLLLTYLYIFQTLYPSMIVDILKLLANRFEEHDAELLLLALTHAGFILRSDDPAGLRDVLKAVHSHISELDSASTKVAATAPASDPAAAGGVAGGLVARFLALHSKASGPATPGAAPQQDAHFRIKVLGELLLDIKNNRKRSEHEQIMERGQQLRKWLGRLAGKTAGMEGVERRMKITWADLVDIPERGRWWLVGSSWVGRAATGGGSAAVAAGGAAGAASSGTTVTSARDAELLALAAKMRMNTAARKSVFVALMGADDVEGAMDRLMRLNLKGSAEREIVRVLLDCAGQEGSYNPFYASVGERLCTYHHRFRFTFQLAFWDAFKTFDDEVCTSRRVFNLGRMLSHLVLCKALTFAILKVLDFARADPRTTLFLKVALSSTILDAKRVDAITDAFKRLGDKSDRLALRDGMAVFLHQFLPLEVLVKTQAARASAGATTRPHSSSELAVRLATAQKALESVTAPKGADDPFADDM